jgi:hypothetical protein
MAAEGHSLFKELQLREQLPIFTEFPFHPGNAQSGSREPVPCKITIYFKDVQGLRIKFFQALGAQLFFYQHRIG